MSFNKFFALIALAVLILAGFASPVALNPDSPKANFARQDEVSSTSVDAYAPETDAKRDLAHHQKARNLTTLMERDKGDLIPPNPAVGDTGGWCWPVPGQDWDPAFAETIQDGIDFLQSNGLICDVGPGPGNCVRVSCSYNAAIYLCNDNDYTITPTCTMVGASAYDIYDLCTFGYKGGEDYTSGQVFNNANWNVVIRYDEC